MPVKAAAIDTPAKRAKLPARANPYWTGVSGGRGGVTLGYRKPSAEKPGAWIAKLAIDKRRAEERIGMADDAKAGAEALSYSRAVTAALEWARQKRAMFEAQAEGETTAADVTVRTAVESYVEARKARNGRTGRDAESRLKLHVLANEKFAETPLAKITAKRIQTWRDGVAGLAPASMNRLLNDLRAALNAKAETHRRELPGSIMAEIRIGTRAIPAADEPRRQILTDADVRRLVDAAFEIDESGDTGRMVLLLAATGARFSQVAAITVADVQPEAERIMIPVSSKGRGQKARRLIPVPVGPDVLASLKPIMAGRAGHEPLLERWRHRQTGPTTWVRDRRGAWTAAAELTRPWQQIVTRARLPDDTVPYALRHSSIVRALRAAVPVRVVAALHDTSVAMIEKHYAAFVLDATEDLARRAVTHLAPPVKAHLRAV